MIKLGYKYKAKYFDYQDDGIYFSIKDPKSKVWAKMFTQCDILENNYIIIDSVESFRYYKYKGITQCIPEVVVYHANI